MYSYNYIVAVKISFAPRHTGLKIPVARAKAQARPGVAMPLPTTPHMEKTRDFKGN